MPLRLRNWCLALLIALYGSVTSVGPALHALPGCEHSTDGGSSCDPSGPEQDRSPDRASVSIDHCSICQFHAQGQILTTSIPLELCERVERQASPDTSTPAPSLCRTASRPRAPPLQQTA